MILTLVHAGSQQFCCVFSTETELIMCGIAGIASCHGWSSEALHEAAVSMAESLVHRGPDDQGVWVDPEHPIALSHRRLSIQDLSAAGHQPMASPSGRYQIVFNGEIYNFKEIAVKLGHLGYCFRGHSDTEVLLAAFEEWGVEATLRLSHGMFAMAIWDRTVKELLLCRDRMGEKPLFFGWARKTFVFASELKALHKIFPDALQVDYSALAAYFRFGYVPTPYSIFSDIFKLQPGTFLRVPIAAFSVSGQFNPLPGQADFSPQPYWDVETIARNGLASPIVDESEAIERFDLLLREVVAQQKVADVPLGAFLSGGVDSSLVSAVMQAVSTRPVKTFTIGFREKEFDEAPYARAIARQIGSEHHEQYVSAEDGLSLIDDLPRYWDEPFADSSQIPSLIVARKARERITVCLTGDGGDELFCGYNRYFATANLWHMRQKVPSWLRKSAVELLGLFPPQVWQGGYSLFKRFIGDRRTQANVGLKVHKFAGLLGSDSLIDAYWFLMSCWQKPEDVLQHAQELPSILDRSPHPGMGCFIHDAMYWDQLGYLADDNLVKGDRASMACSLETRLPLLDHRIVEFSWRLPLAMKYRDGASKWLLRQVLYRYVPKDLIERPKMGFSVPVGEWLRGPLKEWGADLLHAGNVQSSGLLDKKIILPIWREHQIGRYDHSQKLWTLLMWLAWLRHWG
ncbi:MAG: asparagine synthase (glutamine-hydrolyzing) [Desulfobulbaceae bacterium]|nr:MAG: asparagine synthase (glutamine-hydrolyzing) [Desulfobulbaceae bacterium]